MHYAFKTKDFVKTQFEFWMKFTKNKTAFLNKIVLEIGLDKNFLELDRSISWYTLKAVFDKERY